MDTIKAARVANDREEHVFALTAALALEAILGGA